MRRDFAGSRPTRFDPVSWKKLWRHVARVSAGSIERSRGVSSVLFPHYFILITFLDLDFKQIWSTWLLSQDTSHKKTHATNVATVSQKWAKCYWGYADSSGAKRMWLQSPQNPPKSVLYQPKDQVFLNRILQANHTEDYARLAEKMLQDDRIWCVWLFD